MLVTRLRQSAELFVASIRPLASARSRLTILLIVTAVLAGSAAAPRKASRVLSANRPTVAPAVPQRPGKAVTLPRVLAVPAALTDLALGLRAGPVAVPLDLVMPSLGVSASVLGVGITPNNVMDAPMGQANDPDWQQAFWYRGSAVPGALSTALIAGHIDDPLGRPGVFAHIADLQPGDPIIVHDTRSGLDIRFSVTDSKTYTLDQAADPAVLTQMYGVGPVAGTWPQPSADGLSHLTLVTCAGTFRKGLGTHDRRQVVYAVRVA
jgi:hypothetical protein